LRTELDQTKQHETLLSQATEKLYHEQQNNSNQINQLKQNNLNLQNQIASLSQELTKKTQIVIQQLEQINQKDTKLTQQNQAYEDLVLENKKQNQSIQDLEQEKTRQSQRIAELKQQIKVKNQIANELSAYQDLLQTELNLNTTDLATFTAEIKKLKSRPSAAQLAEEKAKSLAEQKSRETTEAKIRQILGLNNSTLPENWENQLTKRANLEQIEQAKIALEIAYQKKVDEVEQLNKINQENSTFTKDLIVWIDNSRSQTKEQAQTDLLTLREKYSSPTPENN